MEESRLAELKASIPELPNDKLLRLMKQYKLPYFDANLMAENPDKADYFEAVAALGSCQPKNISNWLLGDITRIINEECACGRTHRKIDRIIGRSDDMMIIRGVNVFPSQIEQIITGFDEITAHYQIVLTDNGPLDKVTLNVETVPEFPIDEIRKLEDLKARLGAELKSNLQIKVDIKIVEPKSIERSEGKAKRVIDLREGKH